MRRSVLVWYVLFVACNDGASAGDPVDTGNGGDVAADAAGDIDAADVVDTTTDVADTTPDTVDVAPDVADTTPDVADTTPDTVDMTLDVADTTPDVADTTPDVADTTPDVADTTPDTVDTTPDVGDTTPDVADTTPDVADTTPDVADTTPDVAEEVSCTAAGGLGCPCESDGDCPSELCVPNATEDAWYCSIACDESADCAIEPGFVCAGVEFDDGVYTLCLAAADCPALNACGGCSALDATLGSTCGTCDTGVLECDGPDALACGGDLGVDVLNACGGCAVLAGTPLDPCGTCGAGTWQCTESGGIECDGDPGDAAYNGCGGCVDLGASPGDACGECGAGSLQCTGTDAMECVESVVEYNVCGGCETLEGVPGEPCGTCGEGTWECDDAGGIVCVDADVCAPDLRVDGETIILTGDQEFDRIELVNGGIIEVQGFDGALGDPSSGTEGLGQVTIVARSLTIGPTSSIQAVGAGGAGAGAADQRLLLNDAGAGGGYGGRGANGPNNLLQGGPVYGTADGDDIEQGSNGGGTQCRSTCAPCAASDRRAGGVGGGLIVLDVDTLIVEGAIDASGGAGQSGGNVLLGGGGGSGGGIWISSAHLTVTDTGRILANGGVGGSAGVSGSCWGMAGSGGGGGRIKIFAPAPVLDGLVRAGAGAGGSGPGSPGLNGRTGAAGTVTVVDTSL